MATFECAPEQSLLLLPKPTEAAQSCKPIIRREILTAALEVVATAWPIIVTRLFLNTVRVFLFFLKHAIS